LQHPDQAEVSEHRIQLKHQITQICS